MDICNCSDDFEVGISGFSTATYNRNTNVISVDDWQENLVVCSVSCSECGKDYDIGVFSDII